MTRAGPDAVDAPRLLGRSVDLTWKGSARRRGSLPRPSAALLVRRRDPPFTGRRVAEGWLVLGTGRPSEPAVPRTGNRHR